MSICKICAANGKEGVQITWSEKIKNTHTGKLIPLEKDNSTFHKHYEPTKTAIPEPNDYPNPITPTISSTQIQTPKVDLNNLAVIKIIVAALQEYIAIKEAGK